MINGFISIKESCNEGWENMTVSEKGKFCSSCQKHVHDFSRSSADEIKAAYLENKGEICGHVPVKLLQEQHFSNHLQQHHLGFLKKFFIAAVFCFGASLFTIDAAKASTFYKLKISFLNITNTDTLFVRGEVRDKDTRESIPFVSVVAMSGETVVARAETNIDGKYTLKVPKAYTKIDMTVAYYGYTTKVMKAIAVAPGKQIVVDFDLQADSSQMMDGIMIIEPEPIINTEPAPSGKTVNRDQYKHMPK